MKYNYKCYTQDCGVEIVTINKPLKDCGNIEICPNCKKQLTRVYSVGISTNDGFKV